MWDTNTNNKLQIGANIAILLGLVMVAFQINQANTISSGEFLDSTIEADNNRQLSLMGEMPNESMIRVLYQPELATIEDYYIVDRVYDTVLAQLNRTLALEAIDLNLGSVNGMLRANSDLFSCPYGIAYLDTIIVQNERNNRGAGNNILYYDSIKQLYKMATNSSALSRMEKRIERTNEILQNISQPIKPNTN